MKNKVINALIEMGMPANLLGFKYITDFIVLLDSDEWKECKTSALYQKIGKMNNTTEPRVERAIRKAFGTVLSTGDHSAIDKYLTRLNTSNSNLLHVFYLRLTQED